MSCACFYTLHANKDPLILPQTSLTLTKHQVSKNRCSQLVSSFVSEEASWSSDISKRGSFASSRQTPYNTFNDDVWKIRRRHKRSHQILKGNRKGELPGQCIVKNLLLRRSFRAVSVGDTARHTKTPSLLWIISSSATNAASIILLLLLREQIEQS